MVALSDREFYLKHYGRRYKRLLRNFMLCVYCGGYGSGLDHVVPISRAWQVSSGFYIVPCCGSCNSSLGDNLFMSGTERKMAILAYLESNKSLGYDMGTPPRITNRTIRQLRFSPYGERILQKQIISWEKISNEALNFEIKLVANMKEAEQHMIDLYEKEFPPLSYSAEQLGIW